MVSYLIGRAVKQCSLYELSIDLQQPGLYAGSFELQIAATYPPYCWNQISRDAELSTTQRDMTAGFRADL